MAPKSPVKLLAGLLCSSTGHRLAEKSAAREGESKDSGYMHASTTIASPGTAATDAPTDPAGSPSGSSSGTGARNRTASPKLKKPSIFARFTSPKRRARKPSVGGSAPALAATTGNPDARVVDGNKVGPSATSVPALTASGKGRRAASGTTSAVGTSKSTVGSSESMAGAALGSSSGRGTRTSPRKVGSTEAWLLVPVVSIDGKLAVFSNVSRAPSPTRESEEGTKVGDADEPGHDCGATSPVGTGRGSVFYDTAATSSKEPVPSPVPGAMPLPPPPPVSNYLEWCAQNSMKRAHPKIEIPELDAPGPYQYPGTHPPAAATRQESQASPATPTIVQWLLAARDAQARAMAEWARTQPMVPMALAPPPPPMTSNYLECIRLQEVLERPSSPFGPASPRPTAPHPVRMYKQSCGSPRLMMPSSLRRKMPSLQATTGLAIQLPEVVQWRPRVSGDWYLASVRTAMWHASESWLPLEPHLCAWSLASPPAYRVDPQFVLEDLIAKDTPFGMIAWVPGIAPRVQKPSYDVIQRYHAHRRVRLGLPLNGLLRSYAAQPAKPDDPKTDEEFKAMFTEIPGTLDQIYLVWADPDMEVDDQYHFGLQLVPGVSLLRVPPRAFRTCALRGRVAEYRIPQAIPPQITTLIVSGPVAPEGVNNLLKGAGQYLHLTTLDLELDLGGIVAEAIARMPKLIALKLRSAVVLPDDDLARVMTAVGRSVRELDLYTVIGKQTAQAIAQQPWIHTVTHVGLESIPADLVPVLRNLFSFSLRCSTLTHDLATRTGQVLVTSARTLRAFTLDQALAPATHADDAMHLSSMLAAVPATVTDLTVRIHQTTRLHPTPRRVGGFPAATAWTFPPALQRLRVGVFDAVVDLAAWIAAVPESVTTLRVEDVRGTGDRAVVEALVIRAMVGKARRAAESKQCVAEATGISELEECVAGERVENVMDDAVEQDPVEGSTTVAVEPPDEAEAMAAPAPRVLNTEELEWDEYVRWADKMLDT
ncbi:hypothetical protein GGF32_001439 [Allomyces javanicus]|nr:hypothetical protein GGF32_001439 [Allomyces javanicus]